MDRHIAHGQSVAPSPVQPSSGRKSTGPDVPSSSTHHVGDAGGRTCRWMRRAPRRSSGPRMSWPGGCSPPASGCSTSWPSTSATSSGSTGRCAMAAPRPRRSLAGRAGIDERYAREWLEQQAATGILEVDDVDAAPEDRRFSLPEAYAEPLLDRTSPWSISPVGRSVVACAKVLPQLLTAFKTGGGVPWADYGADMIESQGDFNRPWLVNSFGSEILPAIPDIHRRLTADSTGPCRGCRLRCRLGGDRHRHRVPGRPGGRLRPRRVLDRAGAPERRSRGGRGPRHVRGPRHRQRSPMARTTSS